MALVGLTPAIARLSTTTRHGDVDVYAIDAYPATDMACRAAEVHGTAVRYLHALDITTLVGKFGGPALIGSPLAGNGTVTSGGGVTFHHVVFGFSSRCNDGPCYEPTAPR